MEEIVGLNHHHRKSYPIFEWGELVVSGKQLTWKQLQRARWRKNIKRGNRGKSGRKCGGKRKSIEYAIQEKKGRWRFGNKEQKFMKGR
ncbi:hypothetical protein SLEP1_g22492 [Rubroshorea leprosula]|uniref:Ribosomal protein L15 n=1 Tax=Rubroshorea leprosula TaxID=152421 RepID=A0AAV5JI64_9ROSI|nr:hypothetical protein SLEP1_g22492 [Rubroshorea leprosula]